MAFVTFVKRFEHLFNSHVHCCPNFLILFCDSLFYSLSASVSSFIIIVVVISSSTASYSGICANYFLLCYVTSGVTSNFATPCRKQNSLLSSVINKRRDGKKLCCVLPKSKNLQNRRLFRAENYTCILNQSVWAMRCRVRWGEGSPTVIISVKNLRILH